MTHHDEAPTRRFYQGNQLGCTVQGNRRISYLYDGDRPLGQQQLGSAAETLLLLTDANRSVRGESQQHSLRETAYGAYGYRSDDGMKSLLGFNGEVRDSLSGWYLLGKGYRAYNPWLMIFHSPDSMSPFGAGGINSYMYCGGDPVNFRDPTGHFWEGAGWAGLGIGIFGAAMTVLSFGGLAPAYALMMSGGIAAALKGGVALTAIAAGAGALGTGVMQSVVDDKQTKKVLGQISFGLGIASLVLGGWSLQLNGWRSGAVSIDDVTAPVNQPTVWKNPMVQANNLDLPESVVPTIPRAHVQTPPMAHLKNAAPVAQTTAPPPPPPPLPSSVPTVQVKTTPAQTVNTAKTTRANWLEGMDDPFILELKGRVKAHHTDLPANVRRGALPFPGTST